VSDRYTRLNSKITVDTVTNAALVTGDIEKRLNDQQKRIDELEQRLDGNRIQIADSLLTIHTQVLKIKELEAQLEKINYALHYPMCWDTLMFPDPESCIKEMFDCTVCGNAEPPKVNDDE